MSWDIVNKDLFNKNKPKQNSGRSQSTKPQQNNSVLGKFSGVLSKVINEAANIATNQGN